MNSLPKPLALRDWPSFAREPWIDARGEIQLSDDKRHALGRYLAWLREKALPLDSTESDPLLRYLAALRARVVTKPGFYASLCHLVTALTKVHPKTNWDWLRAWRHAWRLEFMPPPNERTGDLGFAPLPFSQWPTETQRLWGTQVPAEWGRQKRLSYRAAYGRLITFCQRQRREVRHDRSTLQAYVAHLGARLPATGHTHVHALQVALAILFPAGDWSWLADRARAMRPHGAEPARCKRHRMLSLAFEEWPAENQQHWLAAISPPAATSRLAQVRRRRQELQGRSADRSGRSRRRVRKSPHCWSEALLKSAEYAYGSFLKTMRDLGEPEASPTPQTVAQWVEHMCTRMTVFSAGNRLHDLGFALRILRPREDWAWLGRDAELLHEAGSPAHDKFAEVVDIAEIREAAVARMRRVEQKSKTVKTALEFQDGLIMLLLSYRPVRRRNLAETRLGVSLIVDAGFTSGRLLYERTKAGNRYEAELPRKLMPWLKSFLATYRPLLAGTNTGNAAWLSREGTPLTAKRIWRRIRRATEQELGKPLTLHRFRDCLASTVSEIAPEHIDDAAHLFGHRRLRPVRRSQRRLPAIETYRQCSGTAAAARKLARIEDRHRLPGRAGTHKR